MVCGKNLVQVSIFFSLSSARSRTGNSELKEPEWSRCQERGEVLREQEEEIQIQASAGGGKRIKERKEKHTENLSPKRLET